MSTTYRRRAGCHGHACRAHRDRAGFGHARGHAPAHLGARDDGERDRWRRLATALLIVALLAAIGMLGHMEAEDLDAHDRWMAEVRDRGAWVMW